MSEKHLKRNQKKKKTEKNPDFFLFNWNRTIVLFVQCDRIEFGRFNYVLILISGIVLTSVILDSCCISFVLPVSECDLNLTPSQKGVLGAISFVGIICSSHMWGFLADTKGRRIIIQPTLAIAFVMSLLSTLTSNFYLFTALRFLNGFLWVCFVHIDFLCVCWKRLQLNDIHDRKKFSIFDSL